MNTTFASRVVFILLNDLTPQRLKQFVKGITSGFTAYIVSLTSAPRGGDLTKRDRTDVLVTNPFWPKIGSYEALSQSNSRLQESLARPSPGS